MNPIATKNQKNIDTTKPMKSIVLAIAILSMTAAAQANLPATPSLTAELSFQLNLDDGVNILSYKVGEVEMPFGKELFLGAKTSLNILADGNVTINTDGKELEGPVSLLVKTSDGKNQEISISMFIGKPENLGIQADETYYTKGFDTAGGYNNEGQVTGQNLLGTAFPADTLHVMLTMPASMAGYEEPADQAVINEAAAATQHAKAGEPATA
jgi:hypothetical protein